ncbi:hypothetical protein C8R43DRAFT_976989 [Mycena crocata]|nr:hypothetical protein C8R43DRAFT_976989 [Mycena crocata]
MFSALFRTNPTRQRYNPPTGLPPPERYNPPPGPPPPAGPAPPDYTPAGGQSHEVSDSNATLGEYEAADVFCQQNPIVIARIFPPDITDSGVDRWGLVLRDTAIDPRTGEPMDAALDPGFLSIQVDQMDKPMPWAREPAHWLWVLSRSQRTAHFRNRGDTCFTSNLPIIAGQYGVNRKRGVYFEVTIRQMRGEGTIALGMQCLPYPPNRLPGWHRKSAALHLDDRRVYVEDSEGGRDYERVVYDEKSGKSISRPNIPDIKDGDTLGCGYEFNNGVGHLFYTYNGALLPVACHGVLEPKHNGQDVDVFAAVGVTDGSCKFDVNFGLGEFRWRGPSHLHQGQWNPDDWNVKGLFRQLGRDEPPEYGS